MKKTVTVTWIGLAATLALQAYGETSNSAVVICGTTVEIGKSPHSPFWDGGREIEGSKESSWRQDCC